MDRLSSGNSPSELAACAEIGPCKGLKWFAARLGIDRKTVLRQARAMGLDVELIRPVVGRPYYVLDPKHLCRFLDYRHPNAPKTRCGRQTQDTPQPAVGALGGRDEGEGMRDEGRAEGSGPSPFIPQPSSLIPSPEGEAPTPKPDPIPGVAGPKTPDDSGDR